MEKTKNSGWIRCESIGKGSFGIGKVNCWKIRRLLGGQFSGGSEASEVAAKFCYGVKIDFTAANAAPLRYAGEVLDMTEDYSEDNLISRTERFLSKSVLRTLKDSIKELKSCESVMPMAEDLGLVQRCIDAISSKMELVDPSLFGWPVNEFRGRRSISSPAIKASSAAEPWFEELFVLSPICSIVHKKS